MAVLASICSDYASSGRRDFSKAWKMIRGLYTSDIHFTTSPKVSQNPNNSESDISECDKLGMSGALLVEPVTPLALEVALSVQQELWTPCSPSGSISAA